MSELCLGVVDFPHLNDKLSTGDLADILEEKYALFTGFAVAHIEEIADKLADSLDGAVENILAGAPVPENPYMEAAEWVTAAMKMFLDSGEAERVGLSGTVPTLAALEGVNRRLKLKKGPRRESFIDSGLLRASFMAWVDISGQTFGVGQSAQQAQAKAIRSIEQDMGL